MKKLRKAEEEKRREKGLNFFRKIKKKQSISILRELTEIAIARCTLRRISAADIF